MLTLRRLREHAASSLALLAVTAIVAALVVGIEIQLAAARDSGAQLELSTRPASDVTLTVSLPAAKDVAAQDATVSSVLDELMVDGERGLPLVIHHSLISLTGVTFDTGDGRETRIALGSRDSLPDEATLVDGDWAASADEATLQEDAARSLGVAVGDVLTRGDLTLTVVGLWRVNDPLDPRWVSDPLSITGGDRGVAGPLMLDADTIRTLDDATTARWTLVPDAAQVTADELTAVPAHWRQVSRELRASLGETSEEPDLTGRLAATAVAFDARATGLRAVEPVALIVIAIIALVALIELSRLETTVRLAEWRLLWSRGTETRQLAALAGGRAAALAAVGASAGSLIVVLALSGTAGWNAIAATGALAVVTPVILAVLAAVMATTASYLAIRGLDAAAQRGTRGRRGIAVAVMALVVLIAAVSTWQLLLHGSPVVAGADGGTRVDPVAVAAPSALLLAVALIGVAVLPLSSAPVEHLARRARGVTAPLAARTLLRRLQFALTPLLLCALAVGQFAVAAGYDETWNTAYSTTRDLRAGTATRLTGPLDSAGITAAAGVDGVKGIAEMRTTDVLFGPEAAEVVALTPEALEVLAPASVRAAAETLRGARAGAALPTAASELRFVVDGADGLAVALTAVLVDDWGRVTRVALTSSEPGSFDAPLPAASGAWRLSAIEAELPDTLPVAEQGTSDEGAVDDGAVDEGAADEGARPFLTVTSVEADGTPVDLDGDWESYARLDQPEALSAGVPEPRVPLDTGYDSVRIVPVHPEGGSGGLTTVVISEALAELSGIEIGTQVTLDLDARGGPLVAMVSGIVPLVPGAESDLALLIDPGVVIENDLRLYGDERPPVQAWLDAPPTARTAEALRDVMPPGVGVFSTAVDPVRGVLASASVALWIGAGGAGLLALVALGSVLGAQVRTRAGEARVLRALGVTAGAQSRMRIAELALVLVLGSVIGAAGGMLVVSLLISAIAGVAVPSPSPYLPTVTGIAWGGMLVALGSFLGVLTAMVVAYGAAVRRGAGSAAAAGIPE